MGHRRHSQPRRGSLAYLPRGRAKSMEARIRAWPNPTLEEPHMLAHVGFKAGCIQVVSIDDREKTPNHGKQLVSFRYGFGNTTSYNNRIERIYKGHVWYTCHF